MPLGVEEPREVAALGEVHHERVAIDVVAGVLVIQPRHRPAFERRALDLLYQSTTSRWPSGLSIGMRITTTFWS